jgi:hypothetical protein
MHQPPVKRRILQARKNFRFAGFFAKEAGWNFFCRAFFLVILGEKSYA